MFTKWLLLRLLEQGRSVGDVARSTGVDETEIQKLLHSGACSRFTIQRLEQTLTCMQMPAGALKS